MLCINRQFSQKGMCMLFLRIKFFIFLFWGYANLGYSAPMFYLANRQVTRSLDTLLDYELVPKEATSNPELTPESWDRIKGMNEFAQRIFSKIGQTSFPRPYFNLWNKSLRHDPRNNADLRPILSASRKLIADYTDTSWYRFHRDRHYTDDKNLLIFQRESYQFDRDIAEGRELALDHILMFLDIVRTQVFPYSLFFGKIEADPMRGMPLDYFHEDGEVITPFTNVEIEPKSLFARCRFILLKTLQELCKKIEKGGHECDEVHNWLANAERLNLLRTQLVYYIDSPGISPRKKPRSPLDSGMGMSRESFFPAYLHLNRYITNIVLRNPAQE